MVTPRTRRGSPDLLRDAGVLIQERQDLVRPRRREREQHAASRGSRGASDPLMKALERMSDDDFEDDEPEEEDIDEDALDDETRERLERMRRSR